MARMTHPATARPVIGVLFAMLVTAALAAATSNQASTGSCVLIRELTAEKPLLERGDCTARLSPASTFKIPHALVALETGVVTTSSVERWDGVRHEQQPEWNHDHTVISALRPSVLWFFQRIAPRIGAERMSTWLERFEYGNRDVSGPIAEYWINGRLRISPREQVQFLKQFYGGGLPITPVHVRAVRQGLEQKPGYVQNALGVHRLQGDWAQAVLNAKTGATTAAGVRVSWLVGALRSSKREYVFSAAAWRADGDVDSLDGARLAVDAFVSAGILPRGARDR
jgi:beta-lactamase class D